MKEQSTPAPQIAPQVKTHPANTLSTLEPLIANNLIDEFKKSLILPVGFDILIACLEIALQHQAYLILDYLSQCKLSSIDGDSASIKKWIIGKASKELFHLMYLEYAAYCNATPLLQNIRSRFLEKIRINKHKELLLAVITGDINKLKEVANIPEKISTEFLPLIVYAAANNQVEVVRHLHERKHNPYSHYCHKNALVAAITQNATQVIDYLLLTEFFPNRPLTISSVSSFPYLQELQSYLQVAVKFHRDRQFVQLVEKGATINSTILRFAIAVNDAKIIEYCFNTITDKQKIEFLSLLPFPLLSELIHKAKPENINKIILFLLRDQHHYDSTHNLLGICLQKIRDNIPKKLFIITHILTHYTQSIKEPTQVRAIFEKAFIQLANIESHETDCFELLALEHSKKFLISILKIRLELVKLLGEDFENLENQISKLNAQHEHAFLLEYQAIAFEIALKIKVDHNLSLSTQFLDGIEQASISSQEFSLSKWPENLMIENLTSVDSALEDDNIFNEAGKRPVDIDLRNPQPSTRPKHP